MQDALIPPPGWIVVDQDRLQDMIDAAVSVALQALIAELPAGLDAGLRARNINQLCRHLKRAHGHGRGLIARSDLLRSTRMPAKDFDSAIAHATGTGAIEEVMVLDNKARFYRLPNSTAVAVPAPRATPPAKPTAAPTVQPTPTPPAIPDDQLAVLDDPEQDSDFWDLSKAIARAQAAKP